MMVTVSTVSALCSLWCHVVFAACMA